MITGILGVLGALTAWFSFEFVKDVAKHKDNLEKETNFLTAGIIGFITKDRKSVV